MSNKPMIDIIVPHYNEPWEVGRKFFLMLSMQRNVDISKVRVIIVQDGKEGALDWANIFASCPYDVQVVTINHAGIPAARNTGIINSKAEWVMFCDFDDMFSDVYSLSLMLGVLPTNEADLLWMSCYQEERTKTKANFVHCLEENLGYTYGKLYRREWLRQHHIEFNPHLKSDYELDFNTLVLAELAPNRVLKITTKFNMFIKTYRPDSYSMNRDTLAERMEDIFYGDMYLVDEFTKRNADHDLKMAVAGAVYDMYYLLNSKPVIPHHDEILQQFTDFYFKHKTIFNSIKQTEKEIVLSNTTNRMTMIIQSLFINYRIETETPPDGEKNILLWLDSLTPVRKKPVTPQPVQQQTQKVPNSNEKAVVYCGTRNTYENILASVKSLLYNTPVDSVYLLIEDDTFPYALPDCVKIINVSNQPYFRKDGPNYNNSWSYMCMMRAAFTKYLPHLDRVLSLDIDIVIDKNISALWNYNLDGYYYAGVNEPVRPAPDYVNFGVIMMNLDLMRKDHIDDAVIDLLNTSRQQCPEQDAFNATCTGHILLIPPEYNYTPFSNITPEPEDPAIIHYAGITYWKSFSPVRKYSNLSWDDILSAQKTTAPRRVVTYTGTRDVYHWMSASAKSLLCHNKIDRIYFFIEDDTFPETLPDCITCINVSTQQFFPPDGLNYDSEQTYMDPIRLALPYLLPDEHVVLSLDDDTIIQDDISRIWETDFNGLPFAAVKETNTNHNPRPPYYNFGVVLMDLDRMRSEQLTDKLIDAFNYKQKYKYKAQDCINDICYKMFVDLPSRYNVCGMTEKTQQKDIIHYAGQPIEKVRFARDSKPYADLPWDDVITLNGKGIDHYDR